MKDKINVAELLRNCPKGMELDCTMFNDVMFDHISVEPNTHPIFIKVKNYDLTIQLTKHGQYMDVEDAKCVIFPKGRTTWEGFHRPFKEGDIIRVRDEYSDATFTYVAILKQIEKGGHIYSHCFYNYEAAEFSIDDYLFDIYNIRFATEEEKAKLFGAIKANGYNWNEETKTLEKLTPDKFDINTLKALQPVLVRNTNGQVWTMDLFSHKIDTNKGLQISFVCVGHCPNQCIPYECNEHLLGITDDCDEYFKTWK